MTIKKLPDGFKPYHTMIICSNKLINVPVPFNVRGFAPLVIGKDHERSLIWLYANVGRDKKGYQWTPLLERNKPVNDGVKLVKIKKNNKIVVQKNLVAELDVQEDCLIVGKLDLRPIGLNIYGDENQLTVGTNKLTNNTFQNMPAMIGIG